MYAATHSFAFDAIYWQKIDPRFFGHAGNPEEAWRERLELLDAKDLDGMESLVARKLKEMDTRVLSWDPDEYTLAFRQQLKARKAEANEEKVVIENDGLVEAN